jgi:hypothetical protein
LDEATSAQLQQLNERLMDVISAVSTLVEAEQPTTDELASAHRSVADLQASYNQIVATLPDGEKLQVERSHGRRVTDLRRMAAKLPQKSSGQAARKAADGGFPFLFQREPPKSIEPPRIVPVPREAPKYRVGGEVEAWCGTCSGLTDHHIVAMVDGEPKQVICQSCKARHGYRTTPARSKSSGAVPAVAKPSAPGKPTMTREEAEAKRKEEARFALMKELAEATAVRPFAAKERYKAGEIVQHPEHGRGKIENVLRGSILVRFRDGLKSLSTL